MLEQVKRMMAGARLKKLKAQAVQRNSAQNPLQKGAQCLLLFTLEDSGKTQAVNFLRKALVNEGMSVDLVGYAADLKKAESGGYDLVSMDDFNWLGKEESAYVRDMLQKPYDFLFHADGDSDVFVQYIVAASRAKTKVGIHQQGNELFYDLMVCQSVAHRKTLEDMFFYTQKMNKDK